MLWGAVGGAIVVMIIGFGWGGWVLGSTSERKTDTMVADALVARLTPMCIAQFNEDAAKDEKLKESTAKNRWERKKFVEQQGWASMPFEKEPDSKVAKLCAEQILNGQ